MYQVKFPNSTFSWGEMPAHMPASEGECPCLTRMRNMVREMQVLFY